MLGKVAADFIRRFVTFLPDSFANPKQICQQNPNEILKQNGVNGKIMITVYDLNVTIN